jgi:hypothetical protein
MPYSIRKVEMWAGEIDDRPGGLAEKLEILTQGGASLEFLTSRRSPENPGKGMVFLTPIRGTKQQRAAGEVGLTAAANLHSVRIEGPDRPGLGSKMTRALADAGMNLRGVFGAAVGPKTVSYISFDSAEEAANAIKLLKKILK